MTISAYDLGGLREVKIEEDVSLTDIGHLAFINAHLTGGDAAALIQFDLARRLDPIRIDLRLDQVGLHPLSGDPRYEAMNAVWHTLKQVHNIGDAKASKVLHLKQPKLFPIIDSHIKDVYRESAAAAAAASAEASRTTG